MDGVCEDWIWGRLFAFFGFFLVFAQVSVCLLVMRAHGLIRLLVMCVRELRDYCYLSGHHEIRAFVYMY